MNPLAPAARPGLPCPRCHSLIEFQVGELLHTTRFRCKQCLLELTLDRTQSRDSLEALGKLEHAIEALNAVKKRYEGQR
jgi:transposase-like protein